MDEIRKEIDKLMHKSDIKETNGIDDSKEWDEIFRLMSENGASREEVNAYENDYTETALSLIAEPLSDIPRGRIMQLLSVLDRELREFMEVFRKYKKRSLENTKLMDKHHQFTSVVTYLCELLHENGDKETTYIPGLDKTNAYRNNTLIEIGNASIDEHYDAIDHAFACYECLIQYIHTALNEDNKALMNAVSFDLNVLDMYVHNILDFICHSNERASDI